MTAFEAAMRFNRVARDLTLSRCGQAVSDVLVFVERNDPQLLPELERLVAEAWLLCCDLERRPSIHLSGQRRQQCEIVKD